MNTGILNKSTGDLLSANEFNSINSAINSKIDGGYSLSELRLLTDSQLTLTKIFYCSESGKETFWKYDSTDITSVDDGLFVVVTSTGKRLKSINNYYVNNIYFLNSGTSKIVSSSFVDFGSNATTFLKLLTTNGNLMLQSGGTFTDSGDKLQVSGDAYLTGKLKLQTGTNKNAGFATLSSGTVTVPNTGITANSIVIIQCKTTVGSIAHEYNYTINAGVSFTITALNDSSNVETACNSVLSYIIIN